MSQEVVRPRIEGPVKRALDSFKSPGQSYAGAIEELLTLQEIEIPVEVEQK